MAMKLSVPHHIEYRNFLLFNYVAPEKFESFYVVCIKGGCEKLKTLLLKVRYALSVLCMFITYPKPNIYTD